MWTYLGQEIDYVPEEAYGFVYRIDFSDGRYYIGKKNFRTKRKRRFGKKEIAKMTDKRLKKYEIVVKESNWREYNSSSKEVQKLIKDGLSHSKKILHICYHSKQLTYYEALEQFKANVLEDEKSLNENILNKFHTNVLI